MKLRSMIVVGVSCLAIMMGGCAKELGLKFNPQETSTYKVITDTTRDIKTERPSINEVSTQQAINRTEITFDQKIQSVDDKGVATAVVTLKEIKHLLKTPDGVRLDFDSAKTPTSQLAKLIGQSYTIMIAPDGNVVGVKDTQKALAAVQGDSIEAKIGQSMLSDDNIKQRHTFVKLPSGKLAKGKSWSNIKAAPTGMLVPKTYKKVYKLKNIKKEGTGDIAVVEMEGLPTSEKAPDQGKDGTPGISYFAKMFDNVDSYKGTLVLDVENGKLLRYNEKLKSEWTMTEPAADTKSDKGPDSLTMGYTYVYSVEKLK